MAQNFKFKIGERAFLVSKDEFYRGEVEVVGVICRGDDPKNNLYKIEVLGDFDKKFLPDIAFEYELYPRYNVSDNEDSFPEHSGHEIVENFAMGKSFKYCRTCQDEVLS